MIFTVFSCRISHDTQILRKHKRCIREVKIILFCRMAYKACAPGVDLSPRGQRQNFDSFVLHVQKLNLFVKFCTYQNALNTNMLFYKCQKNKPWKIGTAKLKQTKSPNLTFLLLPSIISQCNSFALRNVFKISLPTR